MRINNINTQVKLITPKNDFNNNLNVVDNSSYKKENQVSFNGVILVKTKKIVQKFFSSKKHIIKEIEPKDIQKIKNSQMAETPSATSKLKDSTEPVKWEIRENINDQTFNLDKENKEDTTDKNTKKQTNLLNLYT